MKQAKFVKRILLNSTLAGIMIASFPNSSLAQGIPVFDSTAVLHMIDQAKQMAAQLLELKAQVEALTSFKGFAEDLEGINQEMSKMLDTIRQGKEEILSIPEEMVDRVLAIEITERLKAVENISKRIQEAPDLKAMSELQANISLEAQALALLKEQTALVKAEKERKIAAMQNASMRGLTNKMYETHKYEINYKVEIAKNSEDLGSLLEQ